MCMEIVMVDNLHIRRSIKGCNPIDNTTAFEAVDSRAGDEFLGKRGLNIYLD
ncbi:predicted protein [Botrytis cinerea T4]|uniref:Uncharacterized protein n=1 Tax=Botryotinia fuckeliana (strain T4) TaxID=999810 RepID=G2XX34_BOTF4|nr:predicted protein [Botrytis cinerea T4]